jgi:neutral ceramidase
LGNPIDELPVPDFLSPEVKAIQHWAKHKAIGDKPLTPNILPIQILQLGDLAIAGLPNEPTTQVGRRLRATLAPILADCGVKTVVAKGYTNAYSGYVTTYEEYLLQGYEASSTHFGMWTEGAYRQLFRDLALQFTLSPDNRTHDTGLRPHAFTEEELRKRKYIPKKQYGFAATPVNYTVEKD